MLHAAAGTLSSEAASAWNQHPHCGERWSRVVRALAGAGPLHVDRLVALLHSLVEAEGEGAEDADALSNALRKGGTPNLPLGRAVACLMDCDGYIAALAQATLLEAYGSHTVAIEAATLADAFRAHSVERPVNNQTHTLRPRRPRRARVRHRAARPHHQDAAEMPDSPASAVPACPASFPPHCNLPPPPLTSLDAVDLLNELRHPVPTLQTVPVFVRAGVRRALASSLQHLREAYSILQRTTRRPRPSARMEAVLADTPHIPACSLRGRPSRVVMDAASS